MLRGLLLVVLCLALSSAAAAATFTAGVACNGPIQVSGPLPGPANESCDVPHQAVSGIGFSPRGTDSGWAFSSATAGPTGLSIGTAALLDVAGATSGNGAVSGQAWAEWTFDDFLVTGTGSASTPILSAVHLWVSGILSGHGQGDDQGPLTAFVNGGGDFYFEIELNGQSAGWGSMNYRAHNAANNSAPPFENVEGLLVGHYGSGGVISDSITSSQLLIPVGQAFSVRVYVHVGASALVNISGTPADQFDTIQAGGAGVADFLSTVSFATSGPVFDLPPGYTLNSASAGIVNNQLVPEPAVMALVAAGAAGLRAARRRFRSAR